LLRVGRRIAMSTRLLYSSHWVGDPTFWPTRVSARRVTRFAWCIAQKKLNVVSNKKSAYQRRQATALAARLEATDRACAARLAHDPARWSRGIADSPIETPIARDVLSGSLCQ
jgi:hypothetical protein